MHTVYGRDLDLNLLRVFLVVAEAGSVTEAASRLYLTQPAVSAALRRLATAVGAPLFARTGRGLSLTARGQRLLATARPHLAALVTAALSPATFDPASAERDVRLGLSDAHEDWLLPPLVDALAREAPGIRLLVVPVQWRTVGAALSSGAVDLAVTVADDVPAGILRSPLFQGGFVCAFDPARARFSARPTREEYLAHEHVVVSYNGDFRGIVEDALGLRRKVRVSVPSFHAVGAAIDGTALVGTIPEVVARALLRQRPHLRSAPLPLRLEGAATELLYRAASADDAALLYVRGHLLRAAEKMAALPRRRAARRPAREP